MQVEAKKKTMSDQFAHLTDPQKDNVMLMDGQISNKKTQLEQEKQKTLELEKQVEELKQMSILQELIKVKIQCDRAQKEY